MRHRRRSGANAGVVAHGAAESIDDVGDLDGEGTLEWAPYASATPFLASPVRAGPTAPTVDRIVASRYRLDRLLGTGGMGAVWLAHDDVLHRSVALKQLTNEQRDEGASALREARAAARIRHPGVVQVHDVLFEPDGDWIVMEALPGVPLSRIIRDHGPRPLDEVIHIGLQLLSALHAIHDADLVHRDVKPSNVQVCDADRVVLTDFGLSSPSGPSGGLRTGAVTGSLPYLAPETIIDGHFGPPSDLFALGVTLFVAVEGHQPFGTAEPIDVLDAILSGESPNPSQADGPLGEVLNGLLENDPQRRMDARSAYRYLRAIAASTPTAGGPRTGSTEVDTSASMALC
jgi:serine/threonine protein kinase